MAAIKEHFEIQAKMRTWSLALIAIGLLITIIGFITKGLSSEEHDRAVFWGTLLYNSVYFLMICNATMFFVCATTLAMGGWNTTFRRVPEAISTMVPIFGVIAALLLFFIVLSDKGYIYQWLDNKEIADNEMIQGKLGLLNKPFFIIWTILTIGLWSVLGARMRRLSSETDEGQLGYEEGKSFIWRNTV